MIGVFLEQIRGWKAPAIHQLLIFRFPLKDCGNDRGLDSRLKIAGMTGWGDSGNDIIMIPLE
jgi:hypothetical protein